MTIDPTVTLPGTVKRTVNQPLSGAPEKVQIAVIGADHLHAEIRIKNLLTTEGGEKVGLKVGDKVKVTITTAVDAVDVKE